MTAKTRKGPSAKRLIALVAPAVAVTVFIPGPSSSGAFPGENGKVAFVSNRDGNHEIYSMNADGSGQTNLTNNAGHDSAPSWAPDGSKIAFARDGNIYVMNADGSDQASLTTSGLEGDPAWSPDGSQIAFVSFDGEIYVMNADGTDLTNLTNNAADDFAPVWSPDGTKIAFVRGGTLAHHDIYVMNADGSGQTNLMPDDVAFHIADFSPTWSPDGTKIAWGRGGSAASGTGGAEGNTFGSIWIMNADGSSKVSIRTGPVARGELSWSPDGTEVVFVSNRDGNHEVYVVPVGGGVGANLTQDFANDSEPDWQPVPAGTPPSVSIGDASVNEGAPSTTTVARFRVSLSAPSTQTVTLNWSTADDTATAGAPSAGGDYGARTSMTLSFTPGETSKVVSVKAYGDRLVEPDETFFVDLSSPTNATIADGQGVGTILNDD